MEKWFSFLTTPSRIYFLHGKTEIFRKHKSFEIQASFKRVTRTLSWGSYLLLSWYSSNLTLRIQKGKVFPHTLDEYLSKGFDIFYYDQNPRGESITQKYWPFKSCEFSLKESRTFAPWDWIQSSSPFMQIQWKGWV